MPIVTFSSDVARLGDASRAVAGAGSAASATISTPAVAAALGLSTSTAALIAGPVIGGIVIALTLWLNRKGPGQKIATTKIVDEAEPILAQNRDVFLAGPKTAENKEFAVAVFNKIWSEVVDACSNPQYGNPGQRCVSDRSRGGRWDWASYYLDPILETEVTQSSAGSLAGQFEGTLESLVGFLPGFGASGQILLFGAMGLAVLGLVMDGKGD